MRWPWKQRSSEDALTSDDLSDHFVWPQVQWFSSQLQGLGFNPRLIDRVWCATRCLQLNAQQIASMPMRFLGTSQPAWVTSPDPSWYPNGISDAVFTIVRSMYGYGDAFIYITSRYANGLPSGWTVLDPACISVEVTDGMRMYKSSGRLLNPSDVVQISRNPGAVRGNSALGAFGSYMWGSLSAGELQRQVMGDNPNPNSVLKSQRKLTADQAGLLQTQWSEATSTRRGLPAVLPPDIDFQQLSFSPKDLMLLEGQEFNARVIASAFGVPAFMLNMPLAGGLTYQSPEMLVDQWWRLELRPAGKRITDALSSQMLPRGSSVHFDSREVLAPSPTELHKIWLEAGAAGYVTPDEYRQAVLQLGPLGEAGAVDELLQPPSAGASPADQPTADVVALRPNQLSSY